MKYTPRLTFVFAKLLFNCDYDQAERHTANWCPPTLIPFKTRPAYSPFALNSFKNFPVIPRGEILKQIICWAFQAFPEILSQQNVANI